MNPTSCGVATKWDAFFEISGSFSNGSLKEKRCGYKRFYLFSIRKGISWVVPLPSNGDK